MTTVRAVRLAVVLAGLAAAGCVERRFVIESNVPNAQVYIDNKPIGAAPAHAPFDYYGYYNVTLVHPGYEPVARRVHVVAPWYSYPPVDFLAEVLWPFHVEDIRRYYFEMTPAPPLRTDDLINAADSLRQRGWALPSPNPPPPSVLQPPVTPGPTPLPPPTPLPGPGVNPMPPAPPDPLGPPPSVIPSVTPAGFGPPPGGSFVR
ncbi:MAG TPA: PEGA domain-containing protein [Gemmataceae bacterium]|nr:PEGA domain-containing protein [Gemmataceae bacterium]